VEDEVTESSAASTEDDVTLADSGSVKTLAASTEDEPVKCVARDTPTHAVSDYTPNLASALCEMQKSELGAITDSNNPFFNSKYADLSSVWGVIRKPLTDAGLSVMQYTEDYDGGVTVVTRLYHVSGEMAESRLSGKVQPDKKGNVTIQGLGSIITYLRRYSLSMMVGVAPVDDDGEGAVNHGPV